MTSDDRHRITLTVLRAVVYLAIAAPLGAIAGFSLSHLWSGGYRDEGPWVYVAYGASAGLVALLGITVGLVTLRRVLRR